MNQIKKEEKLNQIKKKNKKINENLNNSENNKKTENSISSNPFDTFYKKRNKNNKFSVSLKNLRKLRFNNNKTNQSFDQNFDNEKKLENSLLSEDNDIISPNDDNECLTSLKKKYENQINNFGNKNKKKYYKNVKNNNFGNKNKYFENEKNNNFENKNNKKSYDDKNYNENDGKHYFENDRKNNFENDKNNNIENHKKIYFEKNNDILDNTPFDTSSYNNSNFNFQKNNLKLNEEEGLTIEDFNSEQSDGDDSIKIEINNFKNKIKIKEIYKNKKTIEYTPFDKKKNSKRENEKKNLFQNKFKKNNQLKIQYENLIFEIKLDYEKLIENYKSEYLKIKKMNLDLKKNEEIQKKQNFDLNNENINLKDLNKLLNENLLNQRNNFEKNLEFQRKEINNLPSENLDFLKTNFEKKNNIFKNIILKNENNYKKNLNEITVLNSELINENNEMKKDFRMYFEKIKIKNKNLNIEKNIFFENFKNEILELKNDLVNIKICSDNIKQRKNSTTNESFIIKKDFFDFENKNLDLNNKILKLKKENTFLRLKNNSKNSNLNFQSKKKLFLSKIFILQDKIKNLKSQNRKKSLNSLKKIKKKLFEIKKFQKNKNNINIKIKLNNLKSELEEINFQKKNFIEETKIQKEEILELKKENKNLEEKLLEISRSPKTLNSLKENNLLKEKLNKNKIEKNSLNRIIKKNTIEIIDLKENMMKLEYNNKTDEFVLIIQKLELENKELFKKNKELSSKLYNMDFYKEINLLKKENFLLIQKIKDLKKFKEKREIGFLEKKNYFYEKKKRNFDFEKKKNFIKSYDFEKKNNFIKSYDFDKNDYFRNFEKTNSLSNFEKTNNLENFEKKTSLQNLEKNLILEKKNSLKISKIIPYDDKSSLIKMNDKKKFQNLTGEGFLTKCNLLFDLFEKKEKKNKKTLIHFIEKNLNKENYSKKLVSNSYFIYKKNNVEILVEEFFKKQLDCFEIILNLKICNYNSFFIKLFNFDLNFEDEFINFSKIDKIILDLNPGEKKEIQIILKIKENYILEMSSIFLNFSMIKKNQKFEKEKIILPLSINKFILYKKENIDNFKLISKLKKVSELKIRKKKKISKSDLNIIFPNITELAPNIFGVKLISLYGSSLLYINNSKNEFIKIEIFSFQKSQIDEIYINTLKFIFNYY